MTDPADKGGDKFSAPFIYVVEHDGNIAFFVKSVIHSTFGLEANSSRTSDRIKELRIDEIFIESNGLGLAAVLEIKKMINKTTKLTPYPTYDNKEVKILSNYEFVQKVFHF